MFLLLRSVAAWIRTPNLHLYNTSHQIYDDTNSIIVIKVHKRRSNIAFIIEIQTFEERLDTR